MKILIKNALCLDSEGKSSKKHIIVDNKKVSYVGEVLSDATAVFDRVIDAEGCILSPGFVNAHSHSPMSLLRGLGSGCPLDEWLNDHIFPAEDRLNGELAKIGTLSTIAEMIRGGITSFSDMYFFCDDIADAVIESGIKANISRSVVSFDESENPSDNFRVAETVDLFKKYHGAADGRVLIDFSIHAEYTNTEKMCRYLADLAKEYGARMHIHLSETEKEHLECKSRRGGMTPTEFFESCGIFDVPVLAAHAVWLEEHDTEIMAHHGATAIHNPRSNLKLGSGVMDFTMLSNAGVNIALGTDGSASNNKQDLMSEMQLCAILHKGIGKDATLVPAIDSLKAATVGGSAAQGRCGSYYVREGMDADLVLINCDRPGVSSSEDALSTLVYSSDRNDVVLTMVDGRILFENGEYNTIDAERLSHDFKSARAKLMC